MTNTNDLESRRGVGTKGGQFGHSRNAADGDTADARAGSLDGDDGEFSWEDIDDQTTPKTAEWLQARYATPDEAIDEFNRMRDGWLQTTNDRNAWWLATSGMDPDRWSQEIDALPPEMADTLRDQLDWQARQLGVDHSTEAVRIVDYYDEFGYLGAAMRFGPNRVKNEIAAHDPQLAYRCCPTGDLVVVQARAPLASGVESNEMFAVAGTRIASDVYGEDGVRLPGGLTLFVDGDLVDTFEVTEHRDSMQPGDYPDTGF